jgi:hypothetical protein
LRALPSFTAERALGDADIVAGARPEAVLEEPILTLAPECSGVMLDLCIEQAHRRPGLSPAQLQYELNKCGNTYGCPRRFDCVSDLSSMIVDRTACCLSPRPGQPAQVRCGGVCRDQCSGPRYMDRRTCDCVCAVSCQPPLRPNPSTCICECPNPCPAGKVHDANCQCVCPPPLSDCAGICIDPLTDETFCGGCPGVTCNPATQMCCNGVCTDIGTNADCRACGDRVPAGLGCCNFQPTRLDTTANCGACGRACDPREACCNGTCTPLGTTANCSKCGDVCAAGQGCCNRQCAPLRLSATPVSPNPCPAGQVCCAGGCRKIGTQTDCSFCGNACSTNEGCCLGQCAPFRLGVTPVSPNPCLQVGPNMACCPGGCTQLGTRTNCGFCGDVVPPARECCNGAHSDLLSDPKNCGGCGNAVPQGWACCSGVPIDVRSHINHCGFCGIKCVGGVSSTPPPVVNNYPYPPACQDRECVCPTGMTKCPTPPSVATPYWCAPPGGYTECCGQLHPTRGVAYACKPPMRCCASGCCF